MLRNDSATNGNERPFALPYLRLIMKGGMRWWMAGGEKFNKEERSKGNTQS